MDRYQLSATSLSSMIGGRSELKRVLANDGTQASRRALFEKMKDSRLFSLEEYAQLEHSLNISHIGIMDYQFDQHMKQIMKDAPIPGTEPIFLENGETVEERLMTIKNAQKIEILCINSCHRSMMHSLQPLFNDPDQNISMWHLFHTDAFSDCSSTFLSISLPLLFDMRYHPYAMQRPHNDVHVIGGNFLAVRAHYPAHVMQLCFIVLGENTAVEMANASSANVFAFLSKALLSLRDTPVPLKNVPAQNDDFSALCMNYLSHELNRSTYSITSDLCFFQTPTDIAQAALQDKASFSEADTELLLQRTLAIHEQRYQNHYTKRKDSYQIMTYSGCRRFLETGMFTDHFFGFRAFTPEERKRIFGNMITCAKKNPHFIPLLLKDHDFHCKYNLFCYEKLGISLDKPDTDYDLRKGNRSIFITFPEFTQQYTQYYLDTLIPRICHTAAESLTLLEEMFEDFLDQNH